MSGSDYDLRHWLYEQIPGLKQAYSSEDYMWAAFFLRDWVGRHATFAHSDLILEHGKYTTQELLDKLLAYEGGVWCGGVSRLFSGILRLFPGLYVAEYNFGYHAENLTHMTTLVGCKDGTCYNLDAYFGYHYTDCNGALLDFGEMLRYIRDREYGKIVRVDVELERPAVATSEEDGGRFKWMYDGEMPGPEEIDGRLVYHGATPTFNRLFREGSKNRLRADRIRGEQPLDEFMYDLMFVEPKLSRFAPGVKDSWTEYKVLAQLLYSQMGAP